MKHIILALAAVAITGAASPQRPNAPVMVDTIRSDCPLTINFGSYAMGIDSGAFTRIVQTLQYDRAVRGIEQRNWGREGEKTLCVDIRRPAEIRRVFNRVKALVPPRPRGPVTISASGIKPYTSAAPRPPKPPARPNRR